MPVTPLAIAAYSLASILLFGLPVLGDPAHRYIGPPGDAGAYIWFLRWLPYALSHRMNPLFAPMLYRPYGANLAWVASIPAPAFLMAPITATLGPVVALNALELAAPVLAAFCTYLLARRMTGARWAALVAGYVFGFSPYMVGQTLGDHLNLTLVFLLPLVAYLFLRASDGLRLGRWLWAILGPLLALQFLISTEVFATGLLFGAAALALLSIHDRRFFRAAVAGAAGGLAVCGLLLAPLLWYMLKHPYYHSAPNDPVTFSADLLNFIIPTRLTWIGGEPLSRISAAFTGNFSENGAYAGLPLLLAVAAFVRLYGRTAKGKVLLWLLLIVMVSSLGPWLKVAGSVVYIYRFPIPLPWTYFDVLPIIGYALPVRFMVFGFLVLAIIAALILASPRLPLSLRWPAALLMVVAFLPHPAAGRLSTPVNVPHFFTSGDFRHYLTPATTALLVPDGFVGDGMLDHATAGFSFNMAGGYTGTARPGLYDSSYIAYRLRLGQPLAGGAIPALLRPYFQTFGVDVVVETADHPTAFRAFAESAGLRPESVDDVTLYWVTAR